MTDHVDAETLARFREGLLTAQEAAVVGAHLAGCDLCDQADSQLAFVSELLATAPPPPMPPALSARIEAALAAEAAGRAALTPTPAAGLADPAAVIAAAGSTLAEPQPEDAPGPAPGGSGQAPGGPGTGPGRNSGAGTGPGARRPPQRSARRLARSRARLRAMALAAAIVVIGGGGYAVSQVVTQGGAAVRHRGTAAQRPAASRLQAPAAGVVPSSAASEAGGKQLISTVSSGTRYTARQFSSQLQTVLDHFPAGSAQSSPAGGWRGFPATGVAACVNAVTHKQHPRLVDLASYRGKPATIIVVTGSGTAPAQAWVVGRDCTAAHPDVLAHVTLPGLH